MIVSPFRVGSNITLDRNVTINANDSVIQGSVGILCGHGTQRVNELSATIKPKVRITNGVPANNTDGTIVGTQTSH